MTPIDRKQNGICFYLYDLTFYIQIMDAIINSSMGELYMSILNPILLALRAPR